MSKSQLMIVFTSNAREDIQKLDKHIAKRIQKKLRDLMASNQPLKSAVRLTKPADAQYRWRIGDYRVLFDVDAEKQNIIVLKIQPRRQVYRV